MRVVYVSTIERGGPLSHLCQLAPAVAELGADVLVVCANGAAASALRATGIDAAELPLRHKFDLVGAGRVWPLLRGADLVHTHDRRAGLSAPRGPPDGARGRGRTVARDGGILDDTRSVGETRARDPVRHSVETAA